MTGRRRSERRPYKMTRLSVLLLMVHAASGFKFMSNWKMPTVGDVLKGREAATKFGDKKHLKLLSSFAREQHD